MKKLFKHLKTVRTHRRGVRKLCFKCGLYKQGLLHDLSKYQLVELLPQIKYWTGKRSPIDEEIEDKGYSEAWLHHKGHNKHHYEYWLDPVHMKEPCRMPMRYIAEMFCDRVAACKTYQKDKYTTSSPMEYMMSRPQERELMHPDTYGMLKQLFDLLKQWGEDRTCTYIKELVHNAENPNDLHKPNGGK
jgi:hypothetical protein